MNKRLRIEPPTRIERAIRSLALVAHRAVAGRDEVAIMEARVAQSVQSRRRQPAAAIRAEKQAFV